MRLAEFIETNSEPILAEWVEFARTCGPADTMDLAALRDDAVEMLQIIVLDLRKHQTEAEQTKKSKGKAVEPAGDAETPAEVHGAGRAESGFTLQEMVSEYRALRASVIRLWTRAAGGLTREEDIDDLMRFNEAIDQALAESVTRYTEDLDHSKEMFVAILGHDLRTPLGAVIMASEFMLDLGELKEPSLTLTTRIARSARRMNRMVADLLDFTRSRLGSGLPIVRAPMDLSKVAQQAVDETIAAYPDSVFAVETDGELRGEWDCARISQVFSNLLGNAVQHGSPKTTIGLTVRGEPGQVVIKVHNRGAAIPAAELRGLFSAIKRLKPGAAPKRDASGSLGLGLYIAERIVTAHAGTLTVLSSEKTGTTFTVTLPR